MNQYAPVTWDEQSGNITIFPPLDYQRILKTARDEMHLRDATRRFDQTRPLRDILSDIEHHYIHDTLTMLRYDQDIKPRGAFDTYEWTPSIPEQDVNIVHRILPKLFYADSPLQLSLDQETLFSYTNKDKGSITRHDATLALDVQFRHRKNTHLTKQLTYYTSN